MDSTSIPLTVAELSRRLGAALRGDGTRVITRIAPLDVAAEDALSWLGDAKYLPQFVKTRAAAVLVPASAELPARADNSAGPALLAVADPDVALCDALQLLAPPRPVVPPGVHPTAIVEPGADLAADAGVGPHVFVGRGARIGARTQLHAGVYVGLETVIGADCVLWPGVVVRERVTLGNRVLIHPNATIGADGFGYLQRDGRHVKIPQIGTVAIEDDVEIGANSCIDRARSGVTRIGRGTKIDNLAQIGHNVSVANDCIIVAQCGISGTCTLEHHAVLGGQVGVIDHVRIGAGAQIAAKSLVIRDVDAGQSQMGNPSTPSREFFRHHTLLRKVPEMQQQLRALLKRMEQLESTADDRKGS